MHLCASICTNVLLYAPSCCGNTSCTVELDDHVPNAMQVILPNQRFARRPNNVLAWNCIILNGGPQNGTDQATVK